VTVSLDRGAILETLDLGTTLLGVGGPRHVDESVVGLRHGA